MITDSDGNTVSVPVADIAAVVDTDDQALSLNTTTNILTLEDGGTVDLTPYLENTDDQQIMDFSLDSATNVLTITLEDGGTQTVDISTVSTDDQNLSSSVITANEIVGIQIENGINTTIDIRDADADPTNEIELPPGGSDGQVLSTDGFSTYSWVDPDTGPQGPAGADGADGTNGAQGPAGTRGPDGAHGPAEQMVRTE